MSYIMQKCCILNYTHFFEIKLHGICYLYCI